MKRGLRSFLRKLDVTTSLFLKSKRVYLNVGPQRHIAGRREAEEHHLLVLELLDHLNVLLELHAERNHLHGRVLIHES